MCRQWQLTFGLIITLGAVFTMDAAKPSQAWSQTPQAAATPAQPAEEPDDPYVWLEEIIGEKALDWVRQRNKKSQGELESDPGFEALRTELLAILDSDARIPAISKSGDYYYNFWRDRKNPRGLWRRTTLAEYRKDNPQWEVVLDLDSLANQEHENWVWGGAQLLRPDYTRALISMSRGGADARVFREFDLTTRSFVTDGFNLPESKGSMVWIDKDTVFVQTNTGEGSMTDSGYPRLARIWSRGTPVDDTFVVYEGLQTDMSVMALHDDSPGFERNWVMRNLAFYNNELFLWTDDRKLVKLDVPNSANKQVFFEYLVVEPREAWEVGGQTYAAGSLLITKFEDFLAGNKKFDVLFKPDDNSALASYGFTKDYLYLNVLEDVKNRIQVMKLRQPEWQAEPLVGAPEFGTVQISAVDADESNEYFLTTTDYLTPPTLMWGTIGQKPEKLKSMPSFFDSSNLEISQNFATSADGTKIPYFMVAAKGLKLDGNNPTLLYGYGGFEISMLPSYNAGVGAAWTSRGGVYVVANIRGGGEYGPRWHQAALKQNRARAYEDFAAVAKDLYTRGVSSPAHLGIQGGSNGGLLVGNMVTMYPDLMAAAVCQVPLLDMRRYNKLLAGASWMAEYGNPDLPEEWKFIQHFSPYHNVSAQTKYPAVLFTTSTRDDRVHPGHARKMMALMESQGHDVIYYENIEGGHGGAANNEQSAYMQALAYTFLRQKLFPNPAAEQIRQLTQDLSGVKLTGKFTIRGRAEKSPESEEYYILSAEKQSEGDFWVLTARIKYGSYDLTVPLALEIKFAGDTPVITVDKLTIPGMGTFDARVMIRPDGYAGTWAHDEVGGQMYGSISKLSEQELTELKGRSRRNRQ